MSQARNNLSPAVFDEMSSTDVAGFPNDHADEIDASNDCDVVMHRMLCGILAIVTGRAFPAVCMQVPSGLQSVSTLIELPAYSTAKADILTIGGLQAAR